MEQRASDVPGAGPQGMAKAAEAPERPRNEQSDAHRLQAPSWPWNTANGAAAEKAAATTQRKVRSLGPAGTRSSLESESVS